MVLYLHNFTLPDGRTELITIYDFSDYAQKETMRVISDIKQTNGNFRFAFIPDLHYKFISEMRTSVSNAIHSINAVNREFPIDFVVLGGDNVGNYPGSREEHLTMMRELGSLMDNLDIPWLCAQGNHDDNSIQGRLSPRETRCKCGTEITPDLQYDILFSHMEKYKNFVSGGDKAMYGYFDCPDKNVRTIILNGDEVPHIVDGEILRYTGQWDYGYSGRQLSWFAEKALDFGGNIVLIQHIPFPFAFDNDGIPQNHDVLDNIISSAVNGCAYSEKCPEGDFGFDVSVDFTGKPKQIRAEICGHIHTDNSLINGHGIQNISCILAGRGTGISSDGERITKVPFSRSELFFDFMCFDFQGNAVSAVRYGDGGNRMLRI